MNAMSRFEPITVELREFSRTNTYVYLHEGRVCMDGGRVSLDMSPAEAVKLGEALTKAAQHGTDQTRPGAQGAAHPDARSGGNGGTS